MKRQTLKSVADKVFWVGVGGIVALGTPMVGLSFADLFNVVSSETSMPLAKNLAMAAITTAVPAYLVGGVASIALNK